MDKECESWNHLTEKRVDVVAGAPLIQDKLTDGLFYMNVTFANQISLPLSYHGSEAKKWQLY